MSPFAFDNKPVETLTSVKIFSQILMLNVTHCLKLLYFMLTDQALCAALNVHMFKITLSGHRHFKSRHKLLSLAVIINTLDKSYFSFPE